MGIFVWRKMNSQCGSVERVLQDIDQLMGEQERLEALIMHKERYSLCEETPPDGDVIAPVESKRVTIPYSVLHYIVCERNFLMTNLSALEEALEAEKATRSRSKSQTKKRLSFLNSGRTQKKGEIRANSRGLILGEDIDQVVEKFKPLPKKHIKDSVKVQARQFQKDFDLPLLVKSIPAMMLEPLKGGGAVSTMKGPGHSSAEHQAFGTYCCCRTISSYPLKRNYHVREGDPICDRYFVKLYENRIIAALADGCNWGERPRQAAKKACKAFTLYMNNTHKKAKTLQELGKFMLESFADAHRRILESAGEGYWEAGTTTMIGSMILRATPGDSSVPKWVFLCCNLGDCKGFRYSPQNKVATDLTKDTRVDTQDSGDPGGRLGPRGDPPQPDLRNLSLLWSVCEQNDFIILVSDGVYDNLDPRHLGISPREVGLPCDDWNDADRKAATIANCRFIENKMAMIISSIEELTPQAICTTITERVYEVTEKTREFMVENPNTRLPKDYTKYPGKVDHTSVLCFRVSDVSLSYDQWMGK